VYIAINLRAPYLYYDSTYIVNIEQRLTFGFRGKRELKLQDQILYDDPISDLKIAAKKRSRGQLDYLIFINKFGTRG